MKVRARFFASSREIVGQSQLDLDVPDRATVADLLQQLWATYPALERYGPHLMLAVNADYVTATHPLHDGDEVALIPPVSGG